METLRVDDVGRGFFFSFRFFSVFGARGGGRKESKGGGKEAGRTERMDEGWMDAQVLLLMDPGAELGWTVLSDTLPSAGNEREHICHRWF